MKPFVKEIERWGATEARSEYRNIKFLIEGTTLSQCSETPIKSIIVMYCIITGMRCYNYLSSNEIAL